ncbi:MAG TPA: glycosyltransferase family 25 protein [Ideonella sp.]|nr:glycosyltransferase family 25 protein [Ideonella sp.]HSI47155.1 glycosyltransferase family 25 protein [Ideonella sp.]
MRLYVINLERATDRRASVEGQLGRLAPLTEFIPACDGHAVDFSIETYADLLAPDLRGGTFKPGAFACFLSHAMAWERIGSGAEPYGLVLEDDIVLNESGIANFPLLAVPPDADVVFVNSRMHKLAIAAEWLPDYSAIANADRWMDRTMEQNTRPLPDIPTFYRVATVLERLFSANYYGDSFFATGGDGYLISKAGARRLTAMLHSRKIRMGVDYAMVLHGLTPDFVQNATKSQLEIMPTFCRNFVLRERAWLARNDAQAMGLQTYIYTPQWLVKTDLQTNFPSTIQHNITAKIGLA